MIRIHGEFKHAIYTVQYIIKDVGFWKDGKILPWKSPLKLLLTDEAILRTTNQNNRVRNDLVHQLSVNPSNPNDLCRVRALSHRVHHILSHGGDVDKLFCDYYIENEQHQVTSLSMTSIVRAAVKALKLKEKGIHKYMAESHSLRVGSIMAIKLTGDSPTTIRKWVNSQATLSSCTFAAKQDSYHQVCLRKWPQAYLSEKWQIQKKLPPLTLTKNTLRTIIPHLLSRLTHLHTIRALYRNMGYISCAHNQVCFYLFYVLFILHIIYSQCLALSSLGYEQIKTKFIFQFDI